MNIKEWANVYLKHRDIARKEIKELIEHAAGYKLKTKKGSEQEIVVGEELRNVEADIIICANKQENIKTLVRHWKDFSSREGQVIVFSNPKINQKWLIRPHTHARIADPESLEQGLESMSKAVAEY